jgi:alpha-L-arabinofuranosidase
MDGLIAQFEAAHAGVAVQVQRIQNENFDGRLLTPSAVVEAISLYGDDPFATNAAEHPDRVVLQPNPTVSLDRRGNLRIELSPLSWTALTTDR